MSAWIVSKGHIDCLVQALAIEGLIAFSEADAVGQDLWRENYRSVNYRYDERKRTPRYSFRGVEAPLDVAVVLKQIACYRYQTSERADWPRSKAYGLTICLQTRLLDTLGMTDDEIRETSAWEQAPWGINSIREAIARAISQDKE